LEGRPPKIIFARRTSQGWAAADTDSDTHDPEEGAETMAEAGDGTSETEAAADEGTSETEAEGEVRPLAAVAAARLQAAKKRELSELGPKLPGGGPLRAGASAAGAAGGRRRRRQPSLSTVSRFKGVVWNQGLRKWQVGPRRAGLHARKARVESAVGPQHGRLPGGQTFLAGDLDQRPRTWRAPTSE
jgi:hypothetical protein